MAMQRYKDIDIDIDYDNYIQIGSKLKKSSVFHGAQKESCESESASWGRKDFNWDLKSK